MIKVKQAAKAHQQEQPYQDGLSVWSHMLGLFGQRLWFHHKTKAYDTHLKIHQETCTTCGLFVTLCPMHNLKLEEGMIKTNDKCTMCYRCVNHCPNQSITLLGKQVYEQSLIETYIQKEKI